MEDGFECEVKIGTDRKEGKIKVTSQSIQIKAESAEIVGYRDIICFGTNKEELKLSLEYGEEAVQLYFSDFLDMNACYHSINKHNEAVVDPDD